MTPAFFVLTQYRLVTERRTDGRTDRHVASIYVARVKTDEITETGRSDENTRWPAMMVFTFWQPSVVCFNCLYIVMCHMANKILSLSLSLSISFQNGDNWRISEFLAKVLTKFALFAERRMTFLAAKFFGAY